MSSDNNHKLPPPKRNQVAPAPIVTVQPPPSASESPVPMAATENGMEYTSTVMIGSHMQSELRLSREDDIRCSRRFQSLSEGDKNLAKRRSVSSLVEDTSHGKPDTFQQLLTCSCCPTKVRQVLYYCGSKLLTGFGEEWIFLLLLGTIMACLSYLMDYAIMKFQEAHIKLYFEFKGQNWAQFLSWVGYPLVFISFATGFVHLVGPNAVGSGIPEMKTIIRGVTLHEYLSFRTLISKTVGLTISLGSGMPIGKEGPFVHVASMVATQLSKVVTSFQGLYMNPARNTEMLAAACAVGVACNFAAPIGGVLFSIEVTATYFAVRNYWRGFSSAVVGALVFQLIGMAADNGETITALFRTDLPVDMPFDPLELFIFAFVGVICGFGGALYVFFHRNIVLLMRKPRIHNILSKNRFIYPSIITIFIASVTYPPGLGRYMAADYTPKEQIDSLFANFSWTGAAEPLTAEQNEIIRHWKSDPGGVFVCLSVFIVSKFVLSALAVTMPVPNGIFVPSFLVGAAFGRMVGEFFHHWFPEGLGGVVIKPGGYALVGAAAMAGSVTHTISTSVIVFELTGQISHSLPVLIAVILSNIVAQFLQPSMYDSIIQMKQLPFLPDMVSAHKDFYDIMAENIMLTKFSFIYWKQPYKDVYSVIRDLGKNELVPLVESKESMVLLGTVRVKLLQDKIANHIGRLAQLEFIENGKNFSTLKSQVAKSNRRFTAAAKKVPQASPRRGSRQDATPAANLESRRHSRLFATDLHSFVEARASTNKSKRKIKPLSNMFSGSIVDLAIDENPVSPRLTVQRDLHRRATLTAETMADICITPQEIVEWEELRMKMPIKFEFNEIDESPFSIVTLTSLPKIHSLFSLLGLNKAYVTRMGKLVGVITLNDVRLAVEHSSAYLGAQRPNQDNASTSGSNQGDDLDLDYAEQSSLSSDDGSDGGPGSDTKGADDALNDKRASIDTSRLSPYLNPSQASTSTNASNATQHVPEGHQGESRRGRFTSVRVVSPREEAAARAQQGDKATL